MGSEGGSGLWGTLRTRLGLYGELGRLENGVEAGWPDVFYTLRVPARAPASGWLELKHLAAWPKREGTALNLTHLTLDQVLFAERWTRAGCPSEMLLQVGRDYLLLDAGGMRAVYDRQLTRATALMAAHVTGLGRFPVRELVRHLTRIRPSGPAPPGR